MGKLADLVILQRNPLKVDPATIKHIAVVETIKEGRTIFRRDGAPSGVPAPAGAALPCPHELVGHQGEERALTPEAQRTLSLLKAAARGSGVP